MYKISVRRLHYIAAKSKFNWKDKYNTLRYEYFPYITITFFKKWQIGISFIIDTSNIPKDRWESTQDYWWEKYLQKKYYGKTEREN